MLEDGVSVRVRTESEFGATHSVFFNRGAIASQEYARRFMNLAPDQLTDPRERAAAYKWLSRGLLEALLAFLARASGPEFALRGAIYEFRRAEVLQALRRPRARRRHRRSSTTASTTCSCPTSRRSPANGIAALCSPRTRGSIMHNKFLVLLRRRRAGGGLDGVHEHLRERAVRPAQRRPPGRGRDRRARLPRLLGPAAVDIRAEGPQDLGGGQQPAAARARAGGDDDRDVAAPRPGAARRLRERSPAARGARCS